MVLSEADAAFSELELDHQLHVTMKGVAPSQLSEPVEQEPSLLLHSHSVEFGRTSSGSAYRFPLTSGLYMRIHAAVFTVAAIFWFIVLAWRCFFPRGRGSSSGLKRRRLASGGGQRDDGDDQERPLACENLEELLAAEGGEDFASNQPPPQPAGTSVGAAADEEQPRKKKRKTKHHEEDTGETSEQQAKEARLQEWAMDPLESMDVLLPFFKEPNPTSSPAPSFISEPAESGDSDMLEKLLTTGATTLADWLVVPEGDVPSTTEERRPQEFADFSQLEGTSADFVYHPTSQAMEGRGPWELPGDMELPSTSGAVSGVQPLSSQPPPPHVSQPSQVPQSVSRPEGSASPRGRMTLTPFNAHIAIRSLRNVRGLVSLLRPLEMLLRKEARSEEEQQAIIHYSETLYDYATTFLVRPCQQRKANQLARVAVLRLLVLDALWRACEAVGPPMRKEAWWADFAATLYGDATWWTAEISHVTQESILYEEMIFALKAFRQGRRPPESQFAELMRAVFDKGTGVSKLKGSEWDLWREGKDDS